MNWDDPMARAKLIERVGLNEYNRLLAEHRKASIVATINGHAIRIVNTARFGRLYQVEGGSAFRTLEDATKHAASLRTEPPMGADDQGRIRTYTEEEAKELARKRDTDENR